MGHDGPEAVGVAGHPVGHVAAERGADQGRARPRRCPGAAGAASVAAMMSVYGAVAPAPPAAVDHLLAVAERDRRVRHQDGVAALDERGAGSSARTSRPTSRAGRRGRRRRAAPASSAEASGGRISHDADVRPVGGRGGDPLRAGRVPRVRRRRCRCGSSTGTLALARGVEADDPGRVGHRRPQRVDGLAVRRGAQVRDGALGHQAGDRAAGDVEPEGGLVAVAGGDEEDRARVGRPDRVVRPQVEVRRRVAALAGREVERARASSSVAWSGVPKVSRSRGHATCRRARWPDGRSTRRLGQLAAASWSSMSMATRSDGFAGRFDQSNQEVTIVLPSGEMSMSVSRKAGPGSPVRSTGSSLLRPAGRMSPTKRRGAPRGEPVVPEADRQVLEEQGPHARFLSSLGLGRVLFQVRGRGGWTAIASSERVRVAGGDRDRVDATLGREQQARLAAVRGQLTRARRSSCPGPTWRPGPGART